MDQNSLIITIILIIVVLFFGFLYFSGIELPIFEWLSDFSYNLLTPFLNLINKVTTAVKDFFITLFSIDEINQKLTDLEQENSVLKRQILFLENIQKENKRLRQILNFNEKEKFEVVGAEVTANSPSVWEKIITINKGSKDGLKEKMPVITYDGYLVGRIEKIGINSAQVRLIYDKNFVVGGIIARTDSREIGLVRGSGQANKENLMDNISWDADLEINDLILSSGLSNNFPAGLKIGRITEIEEDNYGLSQKAELSLFINEITIEEVAIITNFEVANEN